MIPGIRKILVSTDFSEMSQRATDYAIGLATKLGASVIIVHVIEHPYPQGVWDFYAPQTAEVEARLEQSARTDLAKIVAGVDPSAVTVTSDLRMGKAADEIVTAARQFGADLIVMATHGRSGLPHLLLGSVAERVIRRSSCPVLAVRPTDEHLESATGASATRVA